MRSALTRDLASWEQGVLSAAELELRHPGRAVGVVALYERLSNLGDGPVPDADVEWDRLRERLPEHPVAVAVRASGNPFDLRRLVSLPRALAASLVLLGAMIGYAVAPEAVNRQLASVWESVEDFFGDESSKDGPTRLAEVEQTSVVPSDSVKDDGDLDQHRFGDDGDRREGHDDKRKGSDERSGGGPDTDGGSDDGSGGNSNVSGGSTDISGTGSRRSDGGSGRSDGGSGDSDPSGGDDDGSGGDDDGDDDGSDGDDGGDG